MVLSDISSEFSFVLCDFSLAVNDTLRTWTKQNFKMAMLTPIKGFTF